MFDFTDSDAQLFRQNIDGEKSHVMLCIFILLSRISRPAIIYNGLPPFEIRYLILQ